MVFNVFPLLGGISIALIALILPFKNKFKWLFALCGLAVAVISLFESTKLMDIISVVLMLAPWLTGVVLQKKVFKEEEKDLEINSKGDSLSGSKNQKISFGIFLFAIIMIIKWYFFSSRY